MATHLVKLTCMATVQLKTTIEVEAPDDATPEQIGKIAVEEAKEYEQNWSLDYFEDSDIDEDSIQAMGDFDEDSEDGTMLTGEDDDDEGVDLEDRTGIPDMTSDTKVSSLVPSEDLAPAHEWFAEAMRSSENDWIVLGAIAQETGLPLAEIIETAQMFYAEGWLEIID